MPANKYCDALAEYFDHTLLDQARWDITFYVEAASRAGFVLELGCGSSRVLIPTAAASVPITRRDVSEALLARGREKLAARQRFCRRCRDIQ